MVKLVFPVLPSTEFDVSTGDFSALEIKKGRAHFHYFYDASERRLITDFLLGTKSRVATLCRVKMIERDGTYTPRLLLWKKDISTGKKVVEHKITGNAEEVRTVRAAVDTSDCHRNFWKIVHYLQSVAEISLPGNDFTVLAGDYVATHSEAESRILQSLVDWINSRNAAQLIDSITKSDVQGLVSFDAAIGVARLRTLLDDMRANLKNADESYWQHRLEENSWLLSQIYAYPLVIVRGQAYVGGKSVTGRGGSVVDYLLKNALTKNALLVEIKTPETDLLASREYRNGVYGCSPELGGATQQLLLARQRLEQNYRELVQDEETPEYRALNVGALLLVGSMAKLPSLACQRSFELYRGNLRQVDVVTFDEMIAKAEALLGLLEEGI